MRSAGTRRSRRRDVWHDRAVFHFLTEAADRDPYVSHVQRALRPGGHLIVATFAEDGPTRCSGLAVARYNAVELQSVFGPRFQVVDTVREPHVTPSGGTQSFSNVSADFRPKPCKSRV